MSNVNQKCPKALILLRGGGNYKALQIKDLSLILTIKKYI